MNTENKKCSCRYLIFILFWAIIIALGFMLIPKAGPGSGGSGSGTGRHGIGTGSGDHGSGSGKGQGDTGVNAGKSRSGNSARTDSAESKKPVPAAKTAGAGGKNVPAAPKVSGTGKLPIQSKEKSTGNVATIYLAGKDTEKGSASGTSAGFFGVDASGPVIFLLDISGSMMSHTKDGGMTRLDLVKKEIEKTLLDRHGIAKEKKSSEHFRIVCFSSGCLFFPDANTHGYRFSSVRNVAEAIDFVKNLSVGGGTEMLRAWQSIIPIIKAEGIQAVYFLSDGEPTDCDSAALLSYLRKNVPALMIHSISMGQSSVLLKDVAQQHRGQYKEVY